MWLILGVALAWQLLNFAHLLRPSSTAPNDELITHVFVLLLIPIMWLQVKYLFRFLVWGTTLLGQNKRFVNVFLAACCVFFGITTLGILALKIISTLSGTTTVSELEPIPLLFFLSSAAVSHYSLLTLSQR